MTWRWVRVPFVVKMLQVLFVITLGVASYGQRIDSSKYFSSCQLDSEDLNDCLKRSVQAGLAGLADGAPEIDLEPLDPLFRSEIELEYKTKEIMLKIFLYNVTTTGLSKIQISAVNASTSENGLRLQANGSAEKVNFSGRFGLFNPLMINYTGCFEITIRKTNLTWDLNCTLESFETGTYCRIREFDIDPDIKTMSLKFKDFNPNNQEIVAMANTLGNQNWYQFYRPLKSNLTNGFSRLAQTLANKVFTAVPYEELFPHNTSIKLTSDDQVLQN